MQRTIYPDVQGADPESSERDGWDTYQLYRYYLFYWEFFNWHYKISLKKERPDL